MTRVLTFVLVAAASAVLAVAVHAASISIDQSGQEFSEKKVTIGVGDTLIFTNRDDVNHNITVVEDDGDSDPTDLGLQRPGENLSHKFDKAGSFRIRCHIHPSMKMKVTVH